MNGLLKTDDIRRKAQSIIELANLYDSLPGDEDGEFRCPIATTIRTQAFSIADKCPILNGYGEQLCTWTGDLVGKMHNHRVSYEDLGNELGVTKAYVSMVLSGARNPTNAKARFVGAFNRIIERKERT